MALTGDALLVQRARDALAAGRRLRIEVGTDPEDPVLELWLADGCVMSAAVGGWSAGCVEPVCAFESDFLDSYVIGRESVKIIDTEG